MTSKVLIDILRHPHVVGLYSLCSVLSRPWQGRGDLYPTRSHEVESHSTKWVLHFRILASEGVPSSRHRVIPGNVYSKIRTVCQRTQHPLVSGIRRQQRSTDTQGLVEKTHWTTKTFTVVVCHLDRVPLSLCQVSKVW